MRYLVLHTREYDFEDDTGRRVNGTTVTYLDPSLAPGDGERGNPPLQLSVANQVAAGFTECPGFYELDFGQKRGKGGKPVVVLTGGRLVAPLSLADL